MRRVLGVLVLVLALVAAALGPAAAGPPTTRELVDRALAVTGQSTGSGPQAGVELRGRAASVRTDVGTIGIRALAEASVTRTRRDGVQVLTVLEHGDREARFAVDLPPGVRLVPDGRRGYDLVARHPQAGAAVLGSIAAPWAVDARGRRVATSYRWTGRELVQRLHGRDLAHPVVADPTVVRNCGILSCTWYVSVLKTRSVSRMLNRTSVGIAGGLSAGVACAVISSPTGPGAVVAGAFCLIASAVGGPAIVRAFDVARRAGDCVTLRVGARRTLGHVDLSHRYCWYR